MKNYLLLVFILSSAFLLRSQTSCQSTKLICPSMSPLPAVNNGSLLTGASSNYLGCLLAAPHPSWYYLRVATSGTIQVQISSVNSDIDFVCLGPFTFTALSNICSSLSYSDIVDCSFSASATETIHLPNAVAGDFYMVLITNPYLQPVAMNMITTGTTGSLACDQLQLEAIPTCTSNATSISALNLSNLTNASYSLNPGGLASYSPNFTVSPSVMTTYTMYCTGTAPSGTVQTITSVINAVPISTLVATASAGSVCAGETLTISATGAASYSLSPGGTTISATAFTVSPAQNTTYTINATAMNGCPSSTTLSALVQPLPLISLTGNTTALCAGETVSITANGGLTYSWTAGNIMYTGAVIVTTLASTTGFTATGADTYNCSNSSAITISVNPLPLIVVNSTHTLTCAGLPVQLLASGAASYTWTAGQGPTLSVSPLNTTQYSVSGTGNDGCRSSSAITISVMPLPIVALFSSHSPVCAFETVTLTANGATSYSWSNTLSSSSPTLTVTNLSVTTVYTVTGTDVNGCSNTAMISINVNALPLITAQSLQTPACALSPVTFTAAGAQTYNWGISASTQSVINIIAPLITTIYTVTGTDTNGCSNSTSFVQNVDACTGLRTILRNDDNKIYPNPNNGLFTITFDTEARLAIINTLGEVISDEIKPAGSTTIDLTDKTNGIYFINLIRGNEQQTFKIIKN